MDLGQHSKSYTHLLQQIICLTKKHMIEQYEAIFFVHLMFNWSFWKNLFFIETLGKKCIYSNSFVLGFE